MLHLFTAFACADLSPPEAAPCASCALNDANQYSYEADISVSTAALPVAEDSVIRWDSLTRDVHGHARDPFTDIDAARLIGFRDQSPEEVLEALATDSLRQADITLFLSCASADASCALSDFGLLGNQLDVERYFEDDGATWLVALNSPLEAGVAAMLFLDPSPDAASHEAVLDDRSSSIDAEVDFETLAALKVEANRADLEIDWSDVTVDGLGNALNAAGIDELVLGRYDARRGALGSKVFDLESAASEVWTMPIDGAPGANLGDLAGDTAFEGISGASTWLLALRCSTCLNPAPRLVTVLEPAR